MKMRTLGIVVLFLLLTVPCQAILLLDGNVPPGCTNVAGALTCTKFLGDGSGLTGVTAGGNETQINRLVAAAETDNKTVQAARLGGTGQDSSAWSGIVSVLAGVWSAIALDGNATHYLDGTGAFRKLAGTFSTLSIGGGNATIDSSGNVHMRTASYIRDAENPFCQQFFAGTNYDDNYTEFCAPNEGYSATTRYVWPVDPPTGNQVMVFPAPTLQVSQGTWGSAGTGDLVSTNNLSDVSNKATARGNLDVPQAGTLEDGHWCVYATDDGINCNQDAPAGGTTAWIVKTSGYTAAAGDKILADSTSAAFTITLPSSPSVGDEVDIADGNGTFGVNNVNVNCNGARIMGQDNNATLAINHSLVRFVYFNANKGWLLFE